jgi:hypothetical protein
MNTNTLFYSKYCKHCKQFLTILKSEGMLDEFGRYICIDYESKLPPFVKLVPTILVEDYDKPLSGEKAFKWISFKSKKRTIQNEKNNNMQVINKPGEIGGFDSGNDFVTINSMESGSMQSINMATQQRGIFDMIEQPLISKEMEQKSMEMESESITSRLQQLENMRSLDDNLNK